MIVRSPPVSTAVSSPHHPPPDPAPVLALLSASLLSVPVLSPLPPAPLNFLLLHRGERAQNLGAIRAGASLQLELRMIAIEPGTHKIEGLQFIDALTEQVHETGTLADVFCHSGEPGPRGWGLDELLS